MFCILQTRACYKISTFMLNESWKLINTVTEGVQKNLQAHLYFT